MIEKFNLFKSKESEAIELGSVEIEEVEVLEEISQETKHMGGQQQVTSKTRYVYLAFNSKGIIALNQNNEPIYSNITVDGEEAKWEQDQVGDYCIEHLKQMEQYRIAIDERKVERKKSGKNDTRVAKGIAKKELRKLAEKLIKEAIESKKQAELEVLPMTNQAEEEVGKNQNKDIGKKVVIEDIRVEKIEIECGNKEIETALIGNKELAPVSGVGELLNELKKDMNSMEDNLNKDITQVLDGLEENTECINNIQTVVEQGKVEVMRAVGDSTQKIVHVINDANHKNRSDVQQVGTAIQQVVANLDIKHSEIMGKAKSVDKKVSELSESTETIEGKLQKLDQLEDIVAVLKDKGVEISRELPPVSEEEEDIINLVRYSKKITEQLGYAARELTRKKAAFEAKNQNVQNEQKIVQEKVEEAKQAGVQEGKKLAIKALIAKYTDMDTIIETQDGHLHCVWSFLQEMGVTIDGDGAYRKGQEITIVAEDVEKMSARYKKIDGEGQYTVTKTGLSFKGEVVFYAEFEKRVEIEETTGEEEVVNKA